MLLKTEEIMEKIIEKIKNNTLFLGLSSEDIQKIFTCCKAKIQKYKNGQFVFEKGDTINSVGIVLEGELNLVSQKFSGARVIVTTLNFNDMFGEAMIFSSSNVSPYDLESQGESMALFIPKSFFTNVCPNSCDFHKIIISNMLSILSDKIVMLNSKMRILNAESIKSKIAIYLLSLYKKTNKLTFDMNMKRHELSEFLNVTRPSLSREFSNMQQENIIEVYRSSVKILNLERLYELAE